jgi:hypothetical protein
MKETNEGLSCPQAIFKRVWWKWSGRHGGLSLVEAGSKRSERIGSPGRGARRRLGKRRRRRRLINGGGGGGWVNRCSSSRTSH